VRQAIVDAQCPIPESAHVAPDRRHASLFPTEIATKR